MSTILRAAFLGSFAAIAMQSSASAQGGALPLTNMNFDMWCQEEAKLPPERCDKRLPEDDAAFNAYRDKIERYEVPYLEQRQDQSNMNRVIFHNDPVDNPPQPSKPQNPNPPDAPPS